MVINSYNATKSYTAMALKTFSNFQLQINDTELYTIPLVYASASRLYKKLAKPDKTFSYRTPIMALDVNIDTDSLERATSPHLKRKVVDVNGTDLAITFNDKPVNYIGTVTVVADTLTTLTNIVEGINSAFYNNVLYKDYKSPLGESIRTPIILQSIEMNIDNNEDIPEMGRLLEATITFKIEGVIHSNYNTTGKRITDIQLIIQTYGLEVDKVIEEYRILA